MQENSRKKKVGDGKQGCTLLISEENEPHAHEKWERCALYSSLLVFFSLAFARFEKFLKNQGTGSVIRLGKQGASGDAA